MVDTSFGEDGSSPSCAPTPYFAPPLQPDFATGSRPKIRGPALDSKARGDPFALPEDSDDDEPAHPSTLVSLIRKEANAKDARARKKEYLDRQSVHPLPRTSVHDDDDDLEILPPPVVSTASASSSSKRRPTFLDTTVATVKRPGLLARHTAPDIQKRPLLTKPIRKIDPYQQLNDDALKRTAAQNAKLRAEKEADWVRRGGKLREAGALNGPQLSELMQQAAESAARRDGENPEGEDGLANESDDEDDGDYRPAEAEGAVSDDDEMGSGVERGPINEETASNMDDDVSGETTTNILSQSTAGTSTSATSFSQDLKPSTSESSLPSSQSSDTELAGSQAVPSLRRSGKSRKANRRVILDEDEEEENENRPPPPDSDAENARPGMDDSDLENMPPPVIEQVMTTDSDDHPDSPGKRSPLKRLTSFSSLSFSLSERGGDFVQSPFSSKRISSIPSSPRNAPLSELDGGESLAETEDADADFGLGGMSQLFGGNTQKQQSQRQMVRQSVLHIDPHVVKISNLPSELASQTQ